MWLILDPYSNLFLQIAGKARTIEFKVKENLKFKTNFHLSCVSSIFVLFSNECKVEFCGIVSTV